MIYSAIRTPEYLLEQWGLWSRIGMNGLDYPSIEPYERLRSPSPGSIGISNEEAEEVDRLVSKLKPINPKAHKYYYMRYCKGYTHPTWIATRLGLHHSTVIRTMRDEKSRLEEWLKPMSGIR